MNPLHKQNSKLVGNEPKKRTSGLGDEYPDIIFKDENNALPVEKQRGLADFDRFGIDFPDEAGVDMKVVLVASTFLIDYLYFEGDNGDSDDD